MSQWLHRRAQWLIRPFPRSQRRDRVHVRGVSRHLAHGIPDPYEHLETYVVSRSLAASDYPEVHVTQKDPVALVRDLKKTDGKDIWLAGGGNLAGQLLHEIDELVIKLNPIASGSGIGLFWSDFDPTAFSLVDANPLSSGTVVLRYQRS